LRISPLRDALPLPVTLLFAAAAEPPLGAAGCAKADESADALCEPVNCASSAMRAGLGAVALLMDMEPPQIAARR